MTHLQHEILHALRSLPKGETLTAIQIRRRCPSISPSLAPETLTRMIETTEGVKLAEPPQASPSGRIVFAARWSLSR
jgi:hypothetical protein